MAIRRKASFNGRVSKRRRTMYSTDITRAVRNLQETKRYTTNYSATNLTDGVTFALNNLGNGNAQGQRIGNRIHNVALEIMMQSNNTGNYRFMIYSPKDPSTEIAPSIGFNAIDKNDNWVIYDTVVGRDHGVLVKRLKLNFKTEWGSNLSTDFQRNPLYVFIYPTDRSGIAGAFDGNFQLFYKDA